MPDLTEQSPRDFFAHLHVQAMRASSALRAISVTIRDEAPLSDGEVEKALAADGRLQEAAAAYQRWVGDAVALAHGAEELSDELLAVAKRYRKAMDVIRRHGEEAEQSAPYLRLHRALRDYICTQEGIDEFKRSVEERLANAAAAAEKAR